MEWTGSWFVSEYACEIEVRIFLYNDTGSQLDQEEFLLDAPCEPVPVPEFSAAEYWSFNDTDYTDFVVGDLMDATVAHSAPAGQGWVLPNATNLTYDEQYWVVVVVTIDDVEHWNLSDYLYATDSDETFMEWTGSWFVSYYNCTLDIRITLFNDTGSLLDQEEFSLDAPCDEDTDGDGTPNGLDDMPGDPNGVSDLDGDGVDDDIDAFPGDANESVDTDGDGTGDNADDDDDGDGVLDDLDSFPFDPSEVLDTDSDGVGDNSDLDDDGDGIPDSLDAFPLDSTEFSDADSDNIGDNLDDDDDDDGTPDSLDIFPLNPLEWGDNDGDGVGNNADNDDDNDGWSDELEAQCGTDPDMVMSTPLDTDGDGACNFKDDDDDGDGILDSDEIITDPLLWDTDGDRIGDDVDAFPSDSTEWSDLDEDGIGDNSDDIVSKSYSSANQPVIYAAGAAAAGFVVALGVGKMVFGSASESVSKKKKASSKSEPTDSDDEPDDDFDFDDFEDF